MIGDYKGEVKNKVLIALLQSYLDVLDYDGLKSILREAELLELKDIKEMDPDQSIDFFSFKKIISAQNCLLYGCYNLLTEIGKKFSFYLFPYGKNFEEVIEEINHFIDADWKIEILDIKTKSSINLIKSATLKIENCIFCSEVGVPCNFIVGFLVHSLKKSLPSNRRVLFSGLKDPFDLTHHSFILKLKSKKNKILNIT
jgi:predicted hydrocarbon binding protein